MTRWARSGCSQKHKKMPGDATSWNEFAKFNYHKKNKQKKEKLQNTNINSKPSYESDKDSGLIKPKGINSNILQKQALMEQKTHIQCGKKRIKSKKQFMHNNENHGVQIKDSISDDQSKIISTETKKTEGKEKLLSPKQKGASKKSKRNKNKKNKNLNNTSKTEVCEMKKKKYMEKLREKRLQQKILLLPPKVERKIYNIKKELRRKGVPPELIKSIIRKERRKQELKFRKANDPGKACYNCRQTGHVLADCPVKLDSENQEIGICFKCGSADHTSFKCPQKVQGFPFAKCFICKQQGHITRDCPSNTHGIYPKGGKCHLCGNVNHLKKDCPNLKKISEEPNSEIKLNTINDISSVDAEVIENQRITPKKEKQPKIVKF